ncbi:YlxM family DNA-binding protein [Schnuerera sp.]|uniref:YlxM family DNA-binding protein n=1 Tax=Schnuerera sp. TaxID=2794844 RepID=UPI002BDF2106|nr:sigma factor-like helix-turn-helix DNA-binding protein [Schnuerera sp.]HSH35876.1 sigma factor-like helix-turn-helix DNA-binding protein [Schnuerera sp.]
MFEKLVEVGILFDFYGKLLSERQFTAIELYYVHDLSLAEIGEELGISRQSVYDTLKRAEENLYEYEKNLGLVNKFKYSIEEIDKIFQLIDTIEKESKNIDNQIMLNSVKDLKEIIRKIIDNNQEVVN